MINARKLLDAVARFRSKNISTHLTFVPPVMPPGVAPKADMLAMDSSLTSVYSYINTCSGFGRGFLGYPALGELMQVPEYRMLSEKTAANMTRKWVKLESKGDDDLSAQIKIIEAAMERLKVREAFKKCAEYDGFMGKGQLFIDMGQQCGPELETSLFLDSAKVGKGKLRKFKFIDPTVTYPMDYNSVNPLADDYYNPSTWYVMGQKVHASRIITFVSRPLPDMLKPAYNFGGISMSQLAQDYVNNWLKTRTSVGKLISNFSTSGIKSDLSTLLQGDDGETVLDRAELFALMRDNQGMMVIDKDTEDFFQSNTPLTTVDKLQAQSQEHMASVSSTPLSVLLGITPTGLNASNDGEMRVYYDFILGMQETLFHDNLKRVIDLIQLSELGEINEDITFKFVSLWQMDDAAKAKIRKDDADAAVAYASIGSVSAEDVRQKLATDPDSGYNGLHVIPVAPIAAEPDSE